MIVAKDCDERYEVKVVLDSDEVYDALIQHSTARQVIEGDEWKSGGLLENSGAMPDYRRPSEIQSTHIQLPPPYGFLKTFYGITAGGDFYGTASLEGVDSGKTRGFRFEGLDDMIKQEFYEFNRSSTSWSSNRSELCSGFILNSDLEAVISITSESLEMRQNSRIPYECTGDFDSPDLSVAQNEGSTIIIPIFTLAIGTNGAKSRKFETKADFRIDVKDMEDALNFFMHCSYKLACDKGIIDAMPDKRILTA